MFRIDLSPLIWLSMNFFRVASFASGNRFRARSSAAAFCGVSPPRHPDERIEVLRVRVQLVPRSLGDRDRAERRPTRRRVEDAPHEERLVRAARERHVDRRAEMQLVPLRVAVVDERAVGAELREHRLRAFLPLELEHRPAGRVDRRREEVLAERARVAGADVRDRLDARCLRNRVGGGDRDRVEVVLGRDRVVRVRPDLVHRTTERCGDAGGEQRDQRDEREADHQRGRSGRGALRVAPSVVAGEPRRSRSMYVGQPCSDAVIDLVDPPERDDEQEHEPRAPGATAVGAPRPRQVARPRAPRVRRRRRSAARRRPSR